MKRNEFLRSALMALAVSLVPKCMQPSLPEVVEDARKCYFDERKLNERLDYIRKHPYTIDECIPEWAYQYQIVKVKIIDNE